MKAMVSFPRMPDKVPTRSRAAGDGRQHYAAVRQSGDRRPRVSMDRRSSKLLLAAATTAALAVVPDWPHRNLTDPNYWGVVGFLLLVLWLLVRRAGSWNPGSANRRTILAFLALVPVVRRPFRSGQLCPRVVCAACLGADVGLGAFVLIHLRQSAVRQPRST